MGKLQVNLFCCCVIITYQIYHFQGAYVTPTRTWFLTKKGEVHTLVCTVFIFVCSFINGLCTLPGLYILVRAEYIYYIIIAPLPISLSCAVSLSPHLPVLSPATVAGIFSQYQNHDLSIVPASNISPVKLKRYHSKKLKHQENYWINR